MFIQTTRQADSGNLWTAFKGGFFGFLLGFFTPDAGGTMDPNGHC